MAMCDRTLADRSPHPARDGLQANAVLVCGKDLDRLVWVLRSLLGNSGRVLYTIGKIKAASTWHAANGAPPQDNWRELVLRELIRRAEDIDADAIIGFDYETDGIVSVEGTGVQLKRILATGVAVKLSCAA